MKHIILIIIILLSNIGYAGNIHHNISDKKYIEYAEKFDCIVRIEMKDNNGQISFGSGVLIKPRVILTAGHMIKDQRLVSVIFKSKKYRSSKFKCHPMFNETFGKDDIAIVKIEEDLSIDAYPELYKDKDELNKVCAIAGYGMTGNGLTGSNHSDNKKRAGTNKIDSIINNMLCCNFSKTDHTIYEFLICPGDSGGGLFIDGKLAGINSCVLAEDKRSNSDYGDESGHTRISDYVDWIEEESRE